MKEIVLVTGNPNKLVELQAIFPSSIALTIKELDLPEIQTLDSREIVEGKLAQAFEQVGKPVIVEDVSVELAALKGLPGTFIRYFEEKLGSSALYILCQHHQDKRATIRCTMGYFDGKTKTIVEGVVKGSIVKPRGENGFGLDFVFMLDGETRTNAEMTPEEKNKTSHRFRAVQALVKELFS